eukprot:TCONS_00010225-protein
MGVSLQYRACIGLFNSIKFILVSFDFCVGFDLSLLVFPNLLFCLPYFFLLFKLTLLLLGGDIESNPGPVERDNTLSVCHWNLNSVWVDNFAKIAQITASLNVHKFDIFCVGESFLDSSIETDDLRLKIDNYELLRSDHSSNSKMGGVCLYRRVGIFVEERPDLSSLDECLVCEVNSGTKKLFLCLLYRSPSQDADEFADFKHKWEQTIINISNISSAGTILLGDFNGRNSEWWAGDTTNSQGEDI